MSLDVGTRVMSTFGHNMTGVVIETHVSGMRRIHWDDDTITDVWPIAVDEIPHEWDELLKAGVGVALPVRPVVRTGWDITVTFHVETAQSEVDALARIGLTGGTPGTPYPGLRSLMVDDSGVSAVRIEGHRCARPKASNEH